MQRPFDLHLATAPSLVSPSLLDLHFTYLTAMRVLGTNQGATTWAQGDNWGSHLTSSVLCLQLGVLKTEEQKKKGKL